MSRDDDRPKGNASPSMIAMAARERLRELLSDLVDRSVGDDVGLVWEAIEALDALDYGEVRPLLRPRPTRRHGAVLTLLELRASIVGHIRPLVECGLTANGALQTIADAIGESVETIRTWESRGIQAVRRERDAEWFAATGSTVVAHASASLVGVSGGTREQNREAIVRHLRGLGRAYQSARRKAARKTVPKRQK